MRIAALIAAFSLAGCATGTDVVESQFAGVEKGKTTRAEIEARLGTPTFVVATTDGMTMLSYVYVDPRIRRKSFAPAALGTRAGVDAITRAAAFYFDDKGTLTDYQGRERRYGTGLEVDGTRIF
jgi:hypothetical protein